MLPAGRNSGIDHIKVIDFARLYLRAVPADRAARVIAETFSTRLSSAVACQHES